MTAFQPVRRRSGVTASDEQDEAQRPDAGGVGDLVDRVGAERMRLAEDVGDRQRHDAGGRRQGDEEDEGFDDRGAWSMAGA